MNYNSDKIEISLGGGGGCSTVYYSKNSVSISNGAFIIYEDNIFELRIYQSDPLFKSFYDAILKAYNTKNYTSVIKRFKKLCISKVTYSNLNDLIDKVYKSGVDDGKNEIKYGFRKLMEI